MQPHSSTKCTTSKSEKYVIKNNINKKRIKKENDIIK